MQYKRNTTKRYMVKFITSSCTKKDSERSTYHSVPFIKLNGEYAFFISSTYSIFHIGFLNERWNKIATTTGFKFKTDRIKPTTLNVPRHFIASLILKACNRYIRNAVQTQKYLDFYKT